MYDNEWSRNAMVWMRIHQMRQDREEAVRSTQQDKLPVPPPKKKDRAKKKKGRG